MRVLGQVPDEQGASFVEQEDAPAKSSSSKGRLQFDGVLEPASVTSTTCTSPVSLSNSNESESGYE